MLIILTVGIISLCICISNHLVVHLKYIQSLFLKNIFLNLFRWNLDSDQIPLLYDLDSHLDYLEKKRS